jgi:CRISPR-associated endonuclease/helicase Cas3
MEGFMEKEDYLAKPTKTIKEHNDDLLERAQTLKDYNLIKNQRIYELLIKACSLHDLGKANHQFQKRVSDSTRKQRFSDEKEIAHNVLSMFFVEPKEFESMEDYYKVLFAVGFHHNYGNVFQIIEEKNELIKSLLKEWEVNTDKIGRRISKNVINIMQEKESILIKGLLHKCDYCASAECDIEYPNMYLNDSLDQLLEQWKVRDANSSWNELQEFCKTNENENIIAIAQTGMGKTEGGLRWIGDNKGFFVLPLRTAINAMYDRISKVILNDKDIEHRLAILHSESLEHYLYNINEGELDIFEYNKRGRQLSMPLSISTMDQLFDFVFKFQGYELKVATLSYSKIVIDEIQMYGPDILAYLVVGLEKIYDMGGKIAIITATLPPFLKDLLCSIPFKQEIFVNDLKRHNVKVITDKINYIDIINRYNENKRLGKNNKILVICNTIKKAQEIYQELIDNIKDTKINEINLLHSRYTREDRKNKEQAITKCGETFSESGELNFRNEIWISTSLVEASLDIDFDYLFTELNDLNSLFQRFGRCNRKGEKNIDEVNCVVYTEIDSGLIKAGNKGFIDRTIYELSKAAVIDETELGLRGIVSERQKIELINKYFTSDNIKESDFMKEFIDIYNYMKNIRLYQEEKKDVDLRNIMAYNIIPSEVFFENKEVILEILEQLKDSKLSYLERIKVGENIKKYIVSIPAYMYLNYVKSIHKGEAYKYPILELSKYEKIPVMECRYTDKGFEMIKYTGAIRPATIL